MLPSLFLAGIMLLLLFISWKYTPNRPSFFGYKTSFSLKNNDTWVYANRLANKVLFINIVVLIVLGITTPYLFEDPLVEIIPFISFTVLSILVIPIVEFFLRRKFDKNGIRKIKL